MKSLSFLIFIISASMIVACSSSTEKAIEYNDAIIAKQQTIVGLFNKLDSSFNDTANHMHSQIHQKLLNEIKSQLSTIDTIKSFNNKDDFKREYKKLLEVYKQVADSEYSKLIEIYSLPDSLYTKVEQDKFTQLWNESSQKIQHAVADFISFQKKFATTYKFTLSD
jgi:ABC-type multidrug transport system fused ATPase/permease subunit